MNNRGSVMTMTVTFLWPRWGVRSYPIVTRVTSDAVVPSTRLDLLISIIGGFIRIWLSIPNQFVIASYLAVAEHQIMFSLHSVSRKKPPTSECINFFFLLYTATYVSYITECEPCTWHHVAHLVFYLNLHTYIWKKRLIVSDAVINIYCTVPGGMCSWHLKFILL